VVNAKNKLNLQIDLRIVVGILLAVIAAMLVAWAPWNTSPRSDETILVTGETVLKAEPDEYTFSPVFQFNNADKTLALSQATKKGEEVVASLKKLGVSESDIKTHLDGYEDKRVAETGSDGFTYTFTATIVTDNRELAQKVQDYLTSAGAQGSVSPYATFSEAKRKELEKLARDEATKDARAKADQSAKNLGFSVGRVKSVEDGVGFGDVVPYAEGRAVALDSGASSAGLTVQPGENELRYSVIVYYYVR
jgi:uncharacterized protein YggE